MADRIDLDRIEINYEAVGKLLKGAEVQADLAQRAGRIAAAATAASPDGAEYWVDIQHWPTRAGVFITAGNSAAMEGEATNRALTRALDAGR